MEIFSKKYCGEVIRFILVGLWATGVHYGLYLLLMFWFSANLAYTLGYIVSFVTNYYLSNYFTFRTNPNIKKGLGFAGSHFVNYLLQMGLLNLCLMYGVPKTYAPLIVYAIVVPVNFLLVRLVLKGSFCNSKAGGSSHLE